MADYYVSKSGSDSNGGSQAAPFATIGRASGLVQAGDVVHVGPGTYTGGMKTVADGTEAAPIRFEGDGAVIVTGANDTGWWVAGDHITLDGFEVDGTDGGMRVGVYTSGSYDTVTNATVHNIALGSVNNANGGGGIVADSYYGGTHATVRDSTVYDVGLDNFDQGIYISTSDCSVINNTVYNIYSVGIHLWHNATSALIENNTVYDNGMGILVGSGDYYNGFAGPDDYTSVVNNTVYGNDYGISEQGRTGTHNTYVGNLVYDNANYDYSLQNGNTYTPGDGAVVVPPPEPEPGPMTITIDPGSTPLVIDHPMTFTLTLDPVTGFAEMAAPEASVASVDMVAAADPVPRGHGKWSDLAMAHPGNHYGWDK